MRSDLDHLPPVQRDELERVKQLLMAEFAEATARGSQPWRKHGRILKIVLFGSYARNDWVDEPENGYQSDFDLLIIVSHPNLTDIAEFWYIAEDKILQDSAFGRPVNIIVHTLQDVNQSLSKGEYFWVDIARDGILLYDLPGHSLAIPKPLTSADAYEMAGKYFADWLPGVARALETAQEQMQKGVNDLGWRKESAFSLHQAIERAYICFLLVRTHYFPRSHNIKFLRSLSEDNEPQLIDAWPRTQRIDRRRFELLKRAYVEARYSDTYEIDIDDLTALSETVRGLRNVVEEVSRERIDELREKAGV